VRRPLEPNVVLTDERLRVNPNVVWIGAAAVYAIAGIVPLLAYAFYSIPGTNAPSGLLGPAPTIVAGFAVALAGFWLYMAKRNVPALPWLHPIIGVGTILIGVVAITSNQYGVDVLSYLLLPGMAAAFFMPLKPAAIHLSAITAVMILVGAVQPAPQTDYTLILNIIFFTLVAAALLAFARTRIQDGILHNVALAGRDPLTGVANLRKFNERLQTEIDRADRHDNPLTLLMIDLDDFKQVNDRFSYTLGDAVLVSSARAMQRVVRGTELLARRGGDEFAVIAVGVDGEGAAALTERIRQAVRRERTKLCPDVSPEASVGFAEWRTGESLHDLMRRADSALHVAKLIAHSQKPFLDT
jgi:diguanylate cyclase (GGDEF)-like protein